MGDDRWYRDGLRFECSACGNCCRAREGYAYVYLTTPEVHAMADHLGLSEPEFRERHCELDEGYTILRTQSPDCPFLTEEGRCGVYAVRPMQCRTWPFWVDNLKDERTWKQLSASTCPGMDSGPTYSADEAQAIAERTERWYDSDGSAM